MVRGVGASRVTTREENVRQERERLMEVVVERVKMSAAYKRVVGNKGASGIDGRTVDELKPYVVREWERIKSELLEGGYTPQPVLQVEIPKPDGGVRALGIPTVVDRLIRAGDPSGTGAHVRPGVLRVKLWVPQGPQRTDVRGTGTELQRRRATLGR